MKVLVTGHKGFIGQNLVKYIQDNTDWNINVWEWEPGQYPVVEGNDWVIHLGAISSTTERDVRKIVDQNYMFSVWMFEQCKHHKVNLQYSSSASVYGLGNSFVETINPDPKTPYAWSKLMFEEYCNKYTHDNIVQGFRYFNVYGNYEGHKGNQASPITQFSTQAQLTGHINLFHYSDQYLRDFIAVEDVCRVHVNFINSVTSSGVWNVGTGKTKSFQEIANLISKKYNAHIKYIEMPEILKDSYQKYTCADLSKLEDAIGSQRWITVEEWIAKYKL